MKRRIPSTAALLAFESAARHQRFTLAAEELALTQSAVSRQVASLEALLGASLFRRTRRGVALTPAGEQYAATVRRRLGEVERDAARVASLARGAGTIDLGVVPTFATHWLVPRLPAYKRAHPGVQLNLHVHTRPFLFDESGLDAAIHAGRGGWPGTRADMLMPESMIVVCAPSLVSSRKKRVAARDIARLPRVQMTTRPEAWPDWLAAQGVEPDSALDGANVELFSMAVQAAVHGLGVALVPDYIARGELAGGSLCAPLGNVYASGLAYWLIRPEADAGEPLESLRNWLMQEVVK